MLVCPNKNQISKPLSSFPHGLIIATIYLLFIAKFPKSVASTWRLSKCELEQSLTENIQTKAQR